MKTKKAKYNFDSAVLKRTGISIAEFVADPQNAVYDAAEEIGDDKGYGSEGKGELNEEIWGDLGVSVKNIDDVEFLSNTEEDGIRYTIDGIVPDTKALRIAQLKSEIKIAKASLRTLENELDKLTDLK